jgi:hypothetical protein
MGGALALLLSACGGGGGVGSVVCGDGEISGQEVCDGTRLAGESCSSLGYEGGTLACAADCGSYDTSACEGLNCGDGVAGGQEACDGEDLKGESCSSLGYEGGTLACAADCARFDTTGCTGDPCGNGAVDPAEACDGSNLAGESCASQGFGGGTLSCAPTCDAFVTDGCWRCGDDQIDGTEVCDGTALGGQDCVGLGYDGGTLQCNVTCDGYDEAGCYACGDGVVEGPEVCDGTELGGATCADFGFTGGTLACNATCDDFDRSACAGAGCGNGVREPGEVCDGDALGGLDCTDFGFTGGTLACAVTCDGFDTSGCGNPTCGNGVAEVGEQCDQTDLRGMDCAGLNLGYTGGTLGCASDCQYDVSGCTAAATAGDDCGSAGVIDPALLPLTLGGDTSQSADDYVGSDQCPGITQNEGNNSPDVAYSFTPTSDGVYTFEYEPTYDGAIYLVTDCGDVPGTCLGASECCGADDQERVRADLVTGQTYYVVLDGGYNGQGGAYLLHVSGPCTPSCAGQQCGPDGCGGFCGPCAGGEVCDALSYQCVDPSLADGDTCANALTIPSVPYTTTGFTTGTGNDYEATATGCAGIGNNPGVEGNTSPDVAYSFTPTVTGRYTIEYVPEFDGSVYVATDCGDIENTCLGGSEQGGAYFHETVEVELTAGTTYYIIVDGGLSGGISGNYTLMVHAPCVPDCTGRQCGTDGCGGSCGTCTGTDVCDDSTGTCRDPGQVVGESCQNPHVVDPAALPYVNVDDTTGSVDAYSHGQADCPGETMAHGVNSGDHAYEFTPTTTAYYDITLDAQGWDVMFYVVTDCADVPSTCVYSEDEAWAFESTSVLMESGTTYYLIVDGFSDGGGEEGLYQITVGQPGCQPSCGGKACGDDGCGGVCGTCAGGDVCDPVTFQCVDPANASGNTCANAINVPGAPWSTAGSTTGLTNDYGSVGGACPGIPGTEGEASPDVTYELTPATTGTYTITYTPEFDGALYVVTDCADVAGTCVAGSEGGNDPNFQEVLAVSLTAGTTYYLIVDGGLQGGASGNYTLDISGVCTPSCAGRQCGEDGCGGFCGACTAGDVCDPLSLQCAAPANADGMDCTSAVTLDPASLPVLSSGDTTGAPDDYSYGWNDCPGEQAGEGAGVSDNVFAFTPTATGDYTITLHTPGWDGLFFVVTDCTDVANTCVYAEQDAGPSGFEFATLTFTAGTTYYLIVDGDGAGSAGPYTLLVE